MQHAIGCMQYSEDVMMQDKASKLFDLQYIGGGSSSLLFSLVQGGSVEGCMRLHLSMKHGHLIAGCPFLCNSKAAHLDRKGDHIGADESIVVTINMTQQTETDVLQSHTLSGCRNLILFDNSNRSNGSMQ